MMSAQHSLKQTHARRLFQPSLVVVD